MALSSLRLLKRDCEGENCPTDIATWKIIVYTMIPLVLVAMGVIYFFGVRNMKKMRKKEEAESRFDALDWEDDAPFTGSSSTQRVNSFYTNQKPGYARSTTASSFSTVTPVTVQNGVKLEDKEDPFAYQMEQYSNSMVAVPVVKDASYILPPKDDSDDWGYVDPVTQKPNRAHSPQRGTQSRKGRL
jgi:hypothetical protein